MVKDRQHATEPVEIGLIGCHIAGRLIWLGTLTSGGVDVSDLGHFHTRCKPSRGRPNPYHIH